MDKQVKQSYPWGSSKDKVGALEKLCYANFDFSGQLVATIVNSYLMYFLLMLPLYRLLQPVLFF